MQTDWENSYYVNNQDVIALLKTRQTAENFKEKSNIDNMLIKLLIYLVHTRVRGYRDQCYYEDALQEGIMGLMRAFNEFDQSKGPNFFLVAKWYINSYVRNFIQKNCHKSELCDSSIDCDSFISEEESAEEQYERAQEYRQLRKAIAQLPSMEQKVINLHFGMDKEAMTLQEIGDAYSVSRQRIHQLQCNAISKIKNNMGETNGVDLSGR